MIGWPESPSDRAIPFARANQSAEEIGVTFGRPPEAIVARLGRAQSMSAFGPEAPEEEPSAGEELTKYALTRRVHTC